MEAWGSHRTTSAIAQWTLFASDETATHKFSVQTHLLNTVLDFVKIIFLPLSLLLDSLIIKSPPHFSIIHGAKHQKKKKKLKNLLTHKKSPSFLVEH